MNNSIFKKNKTSNDGSYLKNGINLNDLSATSSNFMSMINPSMRGGGAFMEDIKKTNKNSCVCKVIFSDFNTKHIKDALDLINTRNVCFRCKDNEGNTVLHYLVHCSKSNQDCKNTLFKLVDNKKVTNSNIINAQNNKGETPILIAAFDENDGVVDKLYRAGADPSIMDDAGNNLGIKDDIETESNSTDSIKKNNKNDSGSGLIYDGIPAYIMELANLSGDSKVPDKTSGQTIWAKLRGSMPRYDSEIEQVSKPKELESDMGKDSIGVFMEEKSKPGISETDFKFSSDTLQMPKSSNEGINVSVSENSTEKSTENALEDIIRKYKSDNSKPIENTQTNKKQKVSEILLEKQNEDISEQNTEKLMEAIDAINKMGTNMNSETVESKQVGGKNKISGFRNMNMTDSSVVSESYNINTSTDESGFGDGISDAGYAAFYNEEEFGRATNELSRMMQRQRDNLHQQVLDMIMSMLNKGELEQDSVVIKASERNAKLIKAYIYRKISEKNPQMGGLDKILSISKMSEKQISDQIKDMPDLDELEKNIQKRIEERKSERDSNPKESKKSKKSKNTETSDTLDIDLSETIESEKPKKKSSSKTTKKSSKKKK